MDRSFIAGAFAVLCLLGGGYLFLRSQLPQPTGVVGAGVQPVTAAADVAPTAAAPGAASQAAAGAGDGGQATQDGQAGGDFFSTDTADPEPAQSGAAEGQGQPDRGDGPDVSVETVYYDVYGHTEDEVNAELSSKGPDGHSANAAWTLRWSVVTNLGYGTCQLAPKVHMKIVITLPRWRDVHEVDADLRTRWNRYLAHAIEHEDAHARIDREGAERLYAELLRLPARGDCARLRSMGAEVQSRVMGEMRAKNASFDRDESNWPNDTGFRAGQ